MKSYRQPCPECSRDADPFGGHANFRDRGDGYCAKCGRTIAWHAGTSCFCIYSTGMPAPVADLDLEPVQLGLFAGAVA